LQDWQQVQRALKQYWGYEALRPPQEQVIRALLEKQDALVVLPTGFGKSLCFQLPALLQTGLTLVVSPLIALMEDQVQDLWKRRLPAACLHSELDPALRKRVLRALEENQLRLLYLGPETLFSPPVWERLQQVPLNGLIVDEAHTLVHWGGSFRPDYRRLGLVRPALGQPTFPIAAFTATADPETLSRLRHILDLQNPECIRADPLRTNISLNVAVAWSPADRRRRLLRFLAENPGSGLVYVRTRRDGEELAEWLGRHNQKTATYHGGLEAGSRRRLERAWLEGELRFLVCTNAFGLGINKPDVRWVLHFHPPPNLMDYLQEVGRGGRDGGPCQALMLVSEPTGLLDPTDRQRQAYFYSQQERLLAQARRLLQTLPPRDPTPTCPLERRGWPWACCRRWAVCIGQIPFAFKCCTAAGSRRRGRIPGRGWTTSSTAAAVAGRSSCGILATLRNQPGLPCGTCDRCRASQRR
jgi:ATP-dependent DNA helicase RecQ